MAGAEGNIIGEVGLKVVPVDPAAQFQAGVNQIIKRLEQQAQFQVKAAGLDQVQEQANQAGQAFAQAAFQAAGLTAAIYGIKASIEGAINKLSGLFDQLAQARAGFTSILHSEAAGGQLLADIREFARVSPFVTQELVNYSQQLLGVGVSAKQIIPLLKSTGDIISSVGGDTANLGRVLFTLTQIKSIGSLKGQDTLQLQNSLIPITKYLSEYLHKSAAEIVKMRENAQISSEDVFNALNAQGEKVKGAMDRATRNIQGAKAILSDTITQLFQNQPVLNKIFTDVYKGIQSFANKLGEDSFQQAFAQFFDGVNKLYEGIRPLFEAISKAAGGGAISALQVFGTTLGIFGSALKAIPKGVMEALARLFIALGAIKAPLLLISYITSIKTMASAILPATTGLAKFGTQAVATAAETEAATVATNGLTVAMAENAAVSRATQAARGGGLGVVGAIQGKGGKLGAGILAGSLAATIGGGYLSQSDNAGAKTAGGTLQGAGIGAQLGLLAGPEGAVVGAVVGGALGAITSFMAQSEAKAKKHIEAMKKLGTDAATAFLNAEAYQFGTAASADVFKDQEAEMFRLKRLIADNKAALAETGGLTYRGHATYTLQDKGRKDAEDVVTNSQAALDALTGVHAAAFDPITFGLGQLVEGLGGAGQGFKDLTVQERGHVRVATTDIPRASDVLKKYGINVSDLGSPEMLEGFITMIKSIDGLSSAQQKATLAAAAYNKIFEETKTAASAIFKGEEDKIQGQIDTIKGLADAEAAQHTITTETDKLNAELLAKKAQQIAYQTELNRLLQAGFDKTVATIFAEIAGEKELQRLRKIRGVQDPSGQNQDRGRDGLGVAPTGLEQLGFKKEREKREEEARKAAEEAAKKAADEALQAAEVLKGATESLADKLKSAAEEIAAAAERWVGSIKERTQYEQAISVTTLTRNAQRQVNDVTELASGMTQLRAKGLSDVAMKALGIDNIADLKQVRKLLKASPADLTKLSSTVTDLNQKATDLATREEDGRTQKNITMGIIEAAKTLGLDITKDQAAGIGANFTITTISNADEVAAAIIAALTSGNISR